MIMIIDTESIMKQLLILPKVISKINTIYITISQSFFTEIDKPDLLWKNVQELTFFKKEDKRNTCSTIYQ